MLKKAYIAEEVKAVDEPYTFTATVSTETVDRHGEVVRVGGIDTSTFMKHPVLLSSHRYDDLRKQIGIVNELWTEGKKLRMKYQYFVGEGNEEADWAYKLAQKGIAAFSIGFMPKDYEEGDDEKVRRVYTKSELVEISQVLVPANPDALQNALSSEREEEKLVAKALSEIIEEEEKQSDWAVVGDPDLPLSDERGWDGAMARQEIRRWASSDGSGDKDKIDWNKYRRGFVVGRRGSTNFGDYKLPFARVRDGRLVATRGGVIFAYAALRGARGGVDLPENVKRRAMRFLERYYERFDMEPPKELSWDMYLELQELSAEVEEMKALLLHIEARLTEAQKSHEEGEKPDEKAELVVRMLEELRKTAKEVSAHGSDGKGDR